MKALITATVFVFVAAQAFAQPPQRFSNPSGDPAGSEDLNRLELLLAGNETVFGQDFSYDDKNGAYQCGGATGVQWTKLGDWTRPVRINTDDGWGGCEQRFALMDPTNRLADLKLSINFRASAGADAGQCGEPGEREIIRTATQPAWSRAYRIDTDRRTGGCDWTISVAGRPDVEVRVKFHPDDQGISQCGNPTKSAYTPNAPEYHTAKLNSPVTLGFNTDAQWGGCEFSLQLVKTTPGK